MVPGFMCDARLFAPQLAALRDTHDVRIVNPPAHAISVNAMARDLLSQSPKTFAVLGLSMGAIVAMELIKLAPKRISRLALFDCNPFADTPANSAERQRQIKLVEEGMLQQVMNSQNIPKYFDQAHRNPALEVLCADMANTIGAKAFINHQNAMISRDDQSAILKSIKVPTLIAYGANDLLCPPKNHEYMHGIIVGSKLIPIAGAAHLPTLERPDLCTSIIRDWL